MPRKASSNTTSNVGEGAAPARRARTRKNAARATSVVAAAAGNPHQRQEEIARLAYSYWKARGQQGGCPEEDWLRAEAELEQRRTMAAKAG